MSVKIQTSEYLISSAGGLGVRKGWLPRVVTEAFLESTKDGEIMLSPDPVTMIEGDLAWFNNTGSTQIVNVNVHRGPRSVIAQSPSTVVIHDATSFQVGKSPTADFPSAFQDSFGGSAQIDRPSAAAVDLLFGRFFCDTDDYQVWVPVGEVPPEYSFHFRYRAAIQTPGTWISPTEFDARWEAQARWARLVAWGSPA